MFGETRRGVRGRWRRCWPKGWASSPASARRSTSAEAGKTEEVVRREVKAIADGSDA